jgi:hypothetical protein
MAGGYFVEDAQRKRALLGTGLSHHSRGHAATHHAEAYRGRKVICFVTRNRATHTARKVCRPVGGYSRLTARRVLWGPAGMPPAPKDFGPHFDFPALL